MVVIALCVALLQAAGLPVEPSQSAQEMSAAAPAIAAAVEREEESASTSFYAPAIWLIDNPRPGAAVKFRVRDEALRELLAAGQDWFLELNGVPVSAQVYWPENAANGEDQPLEFEVSSSSGKLVATIDLGANPTEFNQLSLKFTDQELLAAVSVLAGDAPSSCTSLGEPQLVYQRITDTGIVRVNSINCDISGQQYLQLQISAQPDTKLVSVDCRQVPPTLSDYYSVPVSFGAPLSDQDSRRRLLPLEFEWNSLPLRKLKLLVEADVPPVEVAVVRLSPAGGISRTVAESVCGSQLTLAGFARDISTLEFGDEIGGGQPWALALPAVNEPPAEFSGVEAWAAEVYIACVLTEPGELRLQLQAGEKHNTEAAPIAAIRLPQLPTAGEFSYIDAVYPYQESSSKLLPQAGEIDFDIERWKYVMLYSLLGVLCAMVGLNTLRKRKTRGNRGN